LLSLSVRKKIGDFSLNVELASSARRLVLFGPSGSGKTVTLQCLAGLLKPDAGHVELDGRPLFDSAAALNVPPERRRIGYVPQNASLFPHLDVAGNVGYGLRHTPAEQRRAEVAKLLRLVRLEGFERRRPSDLSGGEQQRVALARALAIGPSLMLLDEPFSALDSPVRALLREELLELQEALGFAWVFVTHDLEEAYQLGDEVAVYDAGRIPQFGSRDDVFYRPRSVEVARLVGVRNLFTGQITATDRVILDQGLELPVPPGPPQGRVYAAIRQEDVRVVRKDRPAGNLTDGAHLAGHVLEERHLGFTVSLRFAIDQHPGLELWVDVAIPAYRSLHLATDKQWQLFVPREAVHLISAAE
jgi:molybdate transport system ATP-binding protein